MHAYWDQEKVFDKKNRTRKISWHCSFIGVFLTCWKIRKGLVFTHDMSNIICYVFCAGYEINAAAKRSILFAFP